MIDVRLVFVYLLFKLLVFGNGTEDQGINTQKRLEEHFTRRYEASPIILDDILHEDKEIMIKEKDGSSRQRRQLLPNLFKGSLDTGSLFPVGINAQLGAGIHLPPDQSIIPSLKVSSGIPGALTAVPYPVQLFVVNPQDIDKLKLCDTQTPKIPISTLNPISNITNGDNSIEPLILYNQSESSENLDLVPIKPFINTIVDSVINKSHDIINNTALRLDNEKSLNVSKEKDLHQTTLLNCKKANKPESSLTNHKDDYFLKNEVDEKPLLNNSTESEGTHSENNVVPLIVFEPVDKTNDLNRSITVDPTVNDRRNDSLQNKSQPLLITKDKTTTLNDNCETQPINKKTEYVAIENAKPGSQYINPLKPMEIKYQSEKYEMDCDTENYGLDDFDKNREKFTSVNKPYDQYVYPTYFDYRYLKPVPENIVGYNNYLHNINYKQKNGNMYDKIKNIPICGKAGNENRNVIQEYTNVMPAFIKYAIEGYQYRKPDTNSENNKIRSNGCQLENRTNFIENQSNINTEFIYPMEFQNTYGYLHPQPKNIPVYYKFINQEYENIRPEYTYPFEHENVNTQKYRRVENLAENHGSDSNINDLRKVYRKENSVASMMPRNLKLYDTNNKPSYGLVNMNCGNAGKSKRIQYCCNQHYPFISCNGFYVNQNIPRTYPSYFIYPYAYVNSHL